MKRIALSILGLALVVIAGCVVTSVYPYYTAKDVTFDAVLLGTWSDPAETNSTDAWTFEKISDRTYKLTTRDHSETNEFDTHLFTVDGQKFLDCLTRTRSAYTVPTHLLLRVKSIQPQLEVSPLDYEWLGKLIEKNPRAIRHIIVPKEGGNDDELLTLTADTAELQKFMRKHLKNADAWSDPIVMQKQ